MESNFYNVKKKKKNIMLSQCLQGDLNDTFTACNLFFSVFFKHVYRKKNNIVDHLAKQKVLRQLI
jgi:hypothetical protein